MIAMTLAEIADVVGGVVHDSDPAAQVTGEAFVDSRVSVPGGLFVAVPGEHVDGHDYAAASVLSGAAAVLASRPVGVASVVVADPVEALGRLAHHVVSRLVGARPNRSRLAGVTVIGITGSQGKTGTKDIAAQLLERHGPTVAPVGSFNNEIGVPLTALRANLETRFLISEMGARGHGHIAHLASMVQPTVGAVLNVGVAHLGEFGSQQDIAETKGELVEALPADGLAVLNHDDPLVLAMRHRTAAEALTFGQSGDADVRLTGVHLDDDGHARFTLVTADDSSDVALPLVGEFQAMNAAAAAAVALACGMPFAQVADGLASVVNRSRWRMEVTTTAAGVIVINDAYNANPDSMRAALEALVDLGRRRGSRRTFAVLGEMRELGDASRDEHEAIGRLAVRLGVSQLVVVGEFAGEVHLGASRERPSDTASVRVPDVDAAIRFLVGAVHEGDLVLVKASRAAGLERVASALLQEARPPGVVLDQDVPAGTVQAEAVLEKAVLEEEGESDR